MEKKYRRMEVVPGEIEKLKSDLAAALLQIDALRKGEQKIAENVNSWVERYTELDKTRIAVSDRLETALEDLDKANRLNGELKSLLEYTGRYISHKEPPHTVDEMHLEVPLSFKDNCLRCRIDKALGDVVERPINDFAANQRENLRECENCHHVSADHDAKGRRCTAVLDGGGGCGCRGFVEKRVEPVKNECQHNLIRSSGFWCCTKCNAVIGPHH